MKKFLIFLVVIAAVGTVAYAMYQSHARAASEAQAGDSQQTEKVTRQDIEKTISSNGSVASNRDVDIKCQASGQIKTLPYRDISLEVPAGAVVCELDQKDELPLEKSAEVLVSADQARLAEAQNNLKVAQLSLVTTRARNQAALASAQARAAQAHSKAQRTQDLFANKLESKENVEADQTAAAQADADVQTAQAAIDELQQDEVAIATKEAQVKESEAQLAQDNLKLETAKLNLTYCTVKAPAITDDEKSDPPRWFISSLLANIAPGYIVQSGTSGFSAGTTIMTLSDLSHIYVLAQVDESDIGQVNDPEKGQAAQDVRVTVEAYQNREFLGHVVRVATKGVTTNNVVTFEVKIEVTSPNRVLLRPGMTGTAKFIIASAPDALAIPVAALTHPSYDDPSTGPGRDASAPAASADAPAASSPATTRGGRRGRANRGPSTDAADNTPTQQEGTVTVVKDSGGTETRNVVVGISDGNYYQVLSGLTEGETVVVNQNADSAMKGKNPDGRNGRNGGGRTGIPGLPGGGRGR